MPMLTEIVSRRWKEARAAFESSVRSGSPPGSQVDVDAILEEIAGLIRSVGREELEAVRIAGATPMPASHHFVGAPEFDTDPRAVTGELGGTLPPDSPNASNDGFVLNLGAPATDNKTPTIDQTSDGALAESVGVAAPADSFHSATKPMRRPPTLPGYEIVGILGRGGMGVVYKAVQLGLRRTVALKMILTGEHASSAQVGRFEAEARAVAQVRHPGIVQIYEIGEHDGLPYFTLEFCPGGSLDKKLKHEPQPPREAALLTEKLARAMMAAHAAGVVHRDLKPGNVLLDSAGEPKITDFGLARELDDGAGHTRTGSILGTPSYMSPEQALGDSKSVGPAADQYSLGATLYQLITGHPPFQGANAMETIVQVRTRDPVAPTQLRPECPSDLETICLKALQKEPAKRYASCDAFADDLRSFLDGRPIAARPVSRAEKAWRWAKRNPRVAGLAALVAALLLVISAGGATAAVVFDTKKRQAEGLAEDRRIALDDKEVALKAERKAVLDKDVALKAEQAAVAAKEEQRKKADESFGLARDSLVQVGEEIPDLLDNSLVPRTVKEQILAILADTLTKQLTLAVTSSLQDRALQNLSIKMGDLRTAQGRFQEALKYYQDAEIIAARILKTEPVEKDKAKGNHAELKHKIGNLFLLGRNAPISLQYLTEAEKLHRERLTDPESPEIPEVEREQSLAGVLYTRSEVLRQQLQFDAAVGPAAAAVKLYASVAGKPPTPYTRQAKTKLATAWFQLGRIEAKRGKDAEAEQALKAAVAIADDLANPPIRIFGGCVKLAKPPRPVGAQVRLLGGQVNRELGDFLLMRNRLADATPYHERDLELTGGLLGTPEVVAAQNILSNAYYRSGTLASKKGERERATDFFRRCAVLRQAVAEAVPSGFNRLRVASAQARGGNHQVAAAAMDALLAQLPANSQDRPTFLMEGACVYSQCADAVAAGRPDEKLTDEEKTLRDKYFAQGIEKLETLVERFKYSDAVRLRTDPDLDAIRSHPRFQAIVKSLEKPPIKP